MTRTTLDDVDKTPRDVSAVVMCLRGVSWCLSRKRPRVANRYFSVGALHATCPGGADRKTPTAPAHPPPSTTPNLPGCDAQAYPRATQAPHLSKFACVRSGWPTRA